MTDNTQRFSGKAGVYAKARPNYAPDFVDWLFSNYVLKSDSVIADIGSGTGILTKVLVEKDIHVYAVEPNEDMRKVAESNLKDNKFFHSINGMAESTALPEGSIDIITVAQAFHWFDVEAFKEECKRILRPKGKVILVWNQRDSSSSFVKENAEVFKKYCPNFTGFSGGIDKIDQNIELFFNNNYSKIHFNNDLAFDKDGFINRCLSASYALRQTDEKYDEFEKELELLFNNYSKDEILIMPNETVAYVGEL